MQSLAYITLDLQAVNSAVVVTAKQNDRLSRRITAQLRDGDVPFVPAAGDVAMIRYAKPDGTAGFYDVLEDGSTPAYSIAGSSITITLCEQMLTVPGCVFVEINFYNAGEEKLTTLSFLLRVQASVLSDGEIISSDYYNVLSAQIAALLGSTANPPRIDPVTLNWLLWDEDEGRYVDSGFSSVGTVGPPGPQGVSVTTVTKKSGTGAPGSTDEYNVNLSSGTVAGSFTVYNGADGQGSPGSSTPLKDSGNGVVGTAVAYSREDHRHPMVTPADVGAMAVGAALHVSVAAFSSLPVTVNDLSITAAMRVVACSFGSPGSITSDITWTTADGSLTLAGTISGSTTADIILLETD